ncbi:MAG: oligosaccharide flippase family protein [Candidatus Marinimicrobia bacterium]|nr:oligosaccharide flippase family protein [Candidatus Neomarinimicrobiota bacterium]MBT3501880.1 oligosaccharide flippase family protein [Candidatus Neomarinimicrobiota bacterium]MBT3838594.1 oligosaccharide flippase family protein [Candidatus Neomarinimicrobiota bacterium]MBT3999792.1 oligosaccharide flippase family protein [Candidatus Neomarinimicrobiota bacterium]MBT4281847.1 oligosaccharide flippase family protein [Candidatus Neomarinimicrobiota bacterium]
MRLPRYSWKHPFSHAGINYLIGVGGTMIFIIGGKGLSYLFQITMTYQYGASVAGIFTLWFLSINIMSFLSRWGLDVLSVQLIPKYQGQPGKQWYTIKSILVLSSITSLLFSGFWFLIHPWVAKTIFNNASLATPFFYSIFILFPFNFLFLFGGVLRGFKQFYSFAFVQHFFLHLVALIALFVGNNYLNQSINLQFPIYAFSIGIVGSTLAGIILVYKQYPNGIIIEKTDDKILKAGTPFALSNLSYFLLSWMDALLIGIFLNNESVGIFNLILRIAMIISLPILGINSVSGPKISSAFFSRSASKLKKNILVTVAVGFSTALPLSLIIILFREKILTLFGPEFGMASLPLLILAISQFFHSSTGSAGLSLQMMNRARDFQNILIGAVLLKLCLGTFLIPNFGLTGAAINVMIVTLFWKSTTWLILIKRFKTFRLSINGGLNV